MEILVANQICVDTWYHIISIVCCLGGIVGVLCAIASENEIAIITLIIIMVLGIMGWVFLPAEQPTDQWKYTVHITDDAKYKELVDANYKCSLLFPGEPIYEIIGDELK